MARWLCTRGMRRRTLRSMFATVLTEAALLSAALLCARSAIGTTFVLMDEENLAQSAQAALIGTVTSVDSTMDVGDGSIHTYVSIAPDVILFGDLDGDKVVLREAGGKVSGRRERVFGAPSYALGERVLAFVSHAGDGALHTTAMAMGKYHLSDGDDGTILATRSFDEGSVVVDPQSGTGAPVLPSVDLLDLLARVGRVRSVRWPGDVDLTVQSTTESDAFTYLGEESRWFEPDEGAEVAFLVCPPAGDPELFAEAEQVGAEALGAWSNDPFSSLVLAEGTMDEPMPFESCSGPNRIVFDDPFDEVDNPNDCSGIVAIGGYCALDHEMRIVNGKTFRQIVVGRVTFGDGWANCPIWNACNMAEVATHEIGHAIGLGHSATKGATMAPTVHFDGRCAALMEDDLTGLRSLYPADIGICEGDANRDYQVSIDEVITVVMRSLHGCMQEN